MYTKKKFTVRVITKKAFLFIMPILLIWMVFHHIITAYEQTKYPPLGQLVSIDGKNMHVYTKGSGENTIVLLSGLGTSAPALDFEPLINEMAKTNQVVVVESFGYGWSDATSKERTVENIVKEIRTALKTVNVQGSYMLMPHSISGIYTMYYVNKYPDEVKAVIGIDPTLPQVPDSNKEISYSPIIPEFTSYIAPTGLVRLVSYVLPDLFSPSSEEKVYSKENLKMTRAITARNTYNKNVVNEINNTGRNISKTVHMTFPADMPVLLFHPEEFGVTEEKSTYINFYQTKQMKKVTLKGHHYLHWTRYKEINKHVNEFMKTIESD